MNNLNEVKQLIKTIVAETISVMSEEHDRGEWWIDDSGNTIYADGDVGDSNHEAVVIQTLTGQLLSHFGIHTDVETGHISDYEGQIYDSLMSDDRLSEEEQQEWNMGGGPSEVILRKLIEDKAFEDPKQAEDALYIAYGSATRDARDYAMKYWNWKVMKTFGGYIEIQTWHLKPEDLGLIVQGVWDIMDDNGDEEDQDDSDNKIGDDGFKGPRINVTIQATGRRFHDIPLEVLEKKMPTKLGDYRSGLHSDFVTEDYHHHHKDYRLYEGNRKIVAIFEDNSRLTFEVHFRNNRGEDKEKWRHRAFTTWKSVANEIHGDVTLSDACNPIQKSWRESFKEALKHPKLQEFIRHKPHQKVFDDKGYPAKVQGKPQTCIDPVNFTPRE